MRHKISSSPTSSSGSVCTFVPINDRIAVKIYDQKGYAEDSRDKQEYFYQSGFAPKCGKRVHKIGDNWGYLTEIVETIDRSFLTDDVIDIIEEAFNTWCENNGIDNFDGHIGNIGRRNGRFVLIDFV